MTQAGTSHLTALGWFVVIAFGCLLAAIADWWRKKNPKPPREPRSDISPFTKSLLTGETSPAYTAPVNAVTPGGIRVRQARCCARGHVSPALAVKHADAIRRRIETTGR
jgi:hypothetical protein